jgi:FAD:protein FMN transferase
LKIIIFFLCILSASAQNDDVLYEINASKNLLGTLIEAKVVHTDVPTAQKALYYAFREIERIDSLYSLQKSASELNNLNALSGISPVKVSYELFSMLKRAKTYSEKYEGLFDVSVGPITNLWGFSSDRDITLPSKSALESLLPLVNYKKIILNELDTTVYLPIKGMKLDLGGIAKGYALDRAEAVLKKRKITNFMINAGGDIVTSGLNSKKEKWVIGIKHPRKENDIIAKFKASNIAIATSGDYERYKIIDGKWYHHIIYPSTGMPGVKCRSVTVLWDNAEEGTVIGKYIFLLGVENFMKTQISKQLKYFIVDSSGQCFFNPEFEIERLQD